MGIKITVNADHVRLWKRMLWHWLAFVIIVIIAGWHLKPRPDEVATVLMLPAFIIVPYGAGCIIVAALKLLWPIGLHRWCFRCLRNGRHLLTNKGLRQRP